MRQWRGTSLQPVIKSYANRARSHQELLNGRQIIRVSDSSGVRDVIYKDGEADVLDMHGGARVQQIVVSLRKAGEKYAGSLRDVAICHYERGLEGSVEPVVTERTCYLPLRCARQRRAAGHDRLATAGHEWAGKLGVEIGQGGGERQALSDQPRRGSLKASVPSFARICGVVESQGRL